MALTTESADNIHVRTKCINILVDAFDTMNNKIDSVKTGQPRFVNKVGKVGTHQKRLPLKSSTNPGQAHASSFVFMLKL